MTSSPYNPKKARASLTCNISNFFEPAETSTVDLTENFSIEEFNCHSQSSESSEFDKPFNSEDTIHSHLQGLNGRFSMEIKGRSDIMNQISLFSLNAKKADLYQRKRGQNLNVKTNLKHGGKRPLIIGELPQPFYFSKCFQTFDVHSSQDLAILSLYDTAKLVKPSEEALLATRLIASETFLSSITFGKGRLDGVFITSDLSSHVNVYDIETKKCSRSYHMAKPAKSYGCRVKQERTQLFCGLTNGAIRIFDIRMKGSLNYFSDNETTTFGGIHAGDNDVFNPITSLELAEENYILAASTDKVCLWDLRKGMLINKVSGLFDDGVLKGKFCRGENQRCIVMRYGGSELKTVNLQDETIETFLTIDEPIHDFAYYDDLNELFVLTGKEQAEAKVQATTEMDIEEVVEQPKNMAKSEVKIYSLENDGPMNTDRVLLGKDYQDLKVNDEGTRLWALGKLY